MSVADEGGNVRFYNKLGEPGSPTYRGAKDYPDTIYQGYPGSSTYVWEPRSVGFPFINSDKVLKSIIPNRLSWNRVRFESNSLRVLLVSIAFLLIIKYVIC